MDFRAADNFGFLVGKKISLENVMICRKTKKKYRQNCLGFNFLRGNNLQSPGNLKRLNCGSVLRYHI